MSQKVLLAWFCGCFVSALALEEAECSRILSSPMTSFLGAIASPWSQATSPPVSRSDFTTAISADREKLGDNIDKENTKPHALAND
jgi:hypothetical protein